MTYPLGWSVIPQIVVRRERWPGGYKAKCIPLVSLGQEVLPDQPVQRVERGEVVESIASLPRLALPSVTTHIELKAIRTVGNAPPAQVGETIPAGLHGRVVAITPRGGVVIETRAAIVQGAIGTGNQVVGTLTMWQAGNGVGVTGRTPQVIPPAAILVIPGPLNFSMLRQAVSSGVSGIIASSVTQRDLEGFLAADLVEVLNCQNVEQMQSHLPPLTLFLTEGLGSVAMSARIINLLSQYQGSLILLSGVTSVRQGIYPELVISLPVQKEQANGQLVQPELALVPGAQVRIYGSGYEGAIGVIDYLFSHQQVFSSGIRTRAARVRLEDGSYLVVPMTLLERIG